MPPPLTRIASSPTSPAGSSKRYDATFSTPAPDSIPGDSVNHGRLGSQTSSSSSLEGVTVASWSRAMHPNLAGTGDVPDPEIRSPYDAGSPTVEGNDPNHGLTRTEQRDARTAADRSPHPTDRPE